MLPPDAFLRNMPRCLSLEDRLFFQTIITSYDVVNKSFNEICHFLLYHKNGFFNLDLKNVDFTPLIVHAWTIVDHVHLIRQVLMCFKQKGTLTSSYIENTKKFYEMRRSMDHVYQNFKNLSEKKGAHDPLHGQIMYGFPTSADTFRYIIIPLSPMHHISQVSPTIDTLTTPTSFTDSIFFKAFGHTVNFANTVKDTQTWLIQTNETFAEHIKHQLIEVCTKDKAIDFDKEWANTVSGNVFVAMDFKPESI